jgi:hypothetical protein
MSIEKTNLNDNEYHKNLVLFHSAGKYGVEPTTTEVEKAKKAHSYIRNKELSKNLPNINHLNAFLNQLDSVKLKSPDSTQQKELEKRINFSRSLLKDVYEKAAEYLEILNELEKLKSVDNTSGDVNERLKYQKALKAKDAFRKSKHDTLIDSINIALRYIKGNFAKIDEDLIEMFEAQQKSRNQMVLDVRRQDFPKNIFLPDSVNLNSRDSIADWALATAKELEQTH